MRLSMFCTPVDVDKRPTERMVTHMVQSVNHQSQLYSPDCATYRSASSVATAGVSVKKLLPVSSPGNGGDRPPPRSWWPTSH